MIYCNNCILPNTRPNLYILPSGKCTACDSHFLRKNNSWKNKKKSFSNIIKKIKKKKSLYDCLIPVSGGKDSTWQVLIVLKYKLNPLTFSYKPPLRNKLGQKNLDNLKKLGVDHIDYSVNINTEKKFLKKVFIKFGAVAIPMHMAMWSMSYNLAKKFKIPYIFWGENSANEYGGSKVDRGLKLLDSKWIKKYGVNFNTTAKDWVDKKLSKKNLAPFIKQKLNIRSQDPKSIFLGDYFKWDPITTYNVAKKVGFKNMKRKTKTGTYNYADIDDNLISIHHYLKVFKFGFSRSYDTLSLDIRNKRISRNYAVKKIKKEKFKKPINDIKIFCKFINISVKEFDKICEKFRNKKIWIKKNNKWHLKYPLK